MHECINGRMLLTRLLVRKSSMKMNSGIVYNDRTKRMTARKKFMENKFGEARGAQDGFAREGFPRQLTHIDNPVPVELSAGWENRFVGSGKSRRRHCVPGENPCERRLSSRRGLPAGFGGAQPSAGETIPLIRRRIARGRGASE